MNKIKDKRSSKKVIKTKSVNKKSRENTKKKVRILTIIDYTFLVSLVLSIIFGMQTNGTFFVPFTITLAVTIICMCIILVNAIYGIIKKKFGKKEKII